MRKRGERVDCGRNMIHISKTKELELKKQSLSVGSMLQRLISKDLNLDSALKKCSSTRKKNQMVLTVLETVQSEETDAIPDQLLHSDVNPADSTLDAIDAFIGILATQSGMTELRVVLPRSHSKKEANAYHLPEFIYRIQLPRYYYLVGHPFLIHGGCGSLNRNTRLHFYHGLSQDSQSQTFFVPWKVKDTTEKLIQMRANAVRVRKLKANNRKRLFKT